MKPPSEKFFQVVYLVIGMYALYCYNPFVLFFQNDDFIHIPLSKAHTIFQRNSFRPVCDLSIMFDAYLYDKNSSGYHVTNLLLHSICCLLVFTVSKLVIAKYATDVPAVKAASVVALLFFVYASHSEAVFWILGRSAILGLIFSLLFLKQYLKRELTFSSITKYALLLLLALLSYESSFILPTLSVLFLFIDRRKNDRAHVGIVFISFFLYLAARVFITGEIFGPYELGSLDGKPLTTLVLNYCKLFIRSFIPAYTQGTLMVTLFVVIALIVGLIFLRQATHKQLSILAGVFMFSLFPYSTLGIDAHGYEGERYLYFPVFFLCLLIVLVLSHSIGKPMYLNAVVLAILLIHSVSLSKSAKNFRVAGNTNKVIISAVNTLNGIDTLYVEQLPQAQNGALIMRDGFREAIKWMKTNEPIFYITILSKRSEWLPLKENYAFANNDSVIDASETTPAISKRAALLFFSDSLLYVRKGH